MLTTYIEQILSRLKRAGLVRSIRGAQGGYTLGRKASKITIGEITKTLDGPQILAGCQDDNCRNECEHGTPCVSVLFWMGLEDEINRRLGSTSLQDLIDNWQDYNGGMIGKDISRS
jgi:Rrf2 family protein